VFLWGYSLLLKSDAMRKEYIDSIRRADYGTIDPLLAFARKKRSSKKLDSSIKK
jgi:hypothetical protein